MRFEFVTVGGSSSRSTPPHEMMQLFLSTALVSLLLSFADAREQHVFSLGDVARQVIARNDAQPWSLLLSHDLDTNSCVVLRPIELAQPHRSLQNPDDVQIISKSPCLFDGTDLDREATIEILALNKDLLWAKANEMCAHLEYEYFEDYATLAEYEVV